MRLVVPDTSAIHYLLLIGLLDVIPFLFGKVILPVGLEVTGTLGILNRAAQRGLIDLADAFDRIKRINFRYQRETVAALLAERERDGA